MSAWQVFKFGGSSLGAERRLPVVLRRVAEAGRPLALVVSALGDTTEWLLESGRAAAAGDGTGAAAAVGRALALARTRAAEVLGPGGREELEAPWAPILDDAARALSALSSAQAVEPASLDLLLSVGERLSSQLVAAASAPGACPASRWMRATCSAPTRATETPPSISARAGVSFWSDERTGNGTSPS